MMASFDVAAEDLTCSGCGKKIHKGEMIALVHHRDNILNAITHVDLRCEMTADKKINPEVK